MAESLGAQWPGSRRLAMSAWRFCDVGVYLSAVNRDACEEAHRSGNPLGRSLRYLGVAFDVDTKGSMATCSHVLDEVGEDERLLINEPHEAGQMYEVVETRVHPKYDFAVVRSPRAVQRILFPLYPDQWLHNGRDIMAFGAVIDGVKDERQSLAMRVLKGHVVREHHEPAHPDAASTCELSFPAVKGFSGTPIILQDVPAVGGMIFSNHELYTELYKIDEVVKGDTKTIERARRVVEFGLAHTAYDLRHFLRDLDVNPVVGSSTPAPLDRRGSPG
jgi:hypothetical protein